MRPADMLNVQPVSSILKGAASAVVLPSLFTVIVPPSISSAHIVPGLLIRDARLKLPAVIWKLAVFLGIKTLSIAVPIFRIPPVTLRDPATVQFMLMELIVPAFTHKPEEVGIKN